MTESPLVSVIIPTYKRHEKLNRALKSVVNQTYDNLEIIVVNDYPKEDIEKHIEVEDDRIVAINLDENKGGSGARNVGIENASGEYIAFLDDDDEYLPEKVEKQVRKIEELPEDYGLVAVQAFVILKNNLVKKCGEGNKDGYLFHKHLRSSQILSVTPLVKKECFDEVGPFDEDLESRQDYDIWLRILKEYKVGFVNEPLIKHYRQGDDKISSNYSSRYKGILRFIEKYKEDLKRDKIALRRKYSSLGVDLAYLDTCKSLKYLMKSLYCKKSLTVLPALAIPLPFRRKVLDKIRSINYKIK